VHYLRIISAITVRQVVISYEQKCIFVHIPKTGGTSIEDVVWGSNREARTEKQLWMGLVRPGYNKYQTGGLQHLLATQIRTEVGQSIFDDFFKFSFVRNPWDKVVSQFLYMQKRADLRERIGMEEGSSLKQYLRLIEKVEHVQWYEQWRFITDESGHTMVDFVGRFENFAADVQSVLRKLGIVCNQLPHEMRGVRSHYRDYYDQESRDMVASLYQRDIDSFGYTFDGGLERTPSAAPFALPRSPARVTAITVNATHAINGGSTREKYGRLLKEKYWRVLELTRW
jgi:hypothetical protein